MNAYEKGHMRMFLDDVADVVEQAARAHRQCDVFNDRHCHGEQYGDGQPSDHVTIRATRAQVALWRGRVKVK